MKLKLLTILTQEIRKHTQNCGLLSIARRFQENARRLQLQGLANELRHPGCWITHRLSRRILIKKASYALSYEALYLLVGATGFEPATPCAQGRCATGLRYAPTIGCLDSLTSNQSIEANPFDGNTFRQMYRLSEQPYPGLVAFFAVAW